MTRPRLAIIGSGISGLTAAYFLRSKYDITVFEQNRTIGGHTNTVDVAYDKDLAWLSKSQQEAHTVAIDTGFIVFNDRTYPNFIRLLNHLGVSSVAAPMSLSVRCDRSHIEYCGSSLNGFFAQRTNILRPSFYRFLYDFRRFAGQAKQLLEQDEEEVTVGEFFRKHSYSQAFYQRYFLPMGSAIWSCPEGVFERFPIRFIAQFYHHHGLLSIKNRPQWYVIQGGSRQYIRSLIQDFSDAIVVGAQVQSIRRIPRSSSGENNDTTTSFQIEVCGTLDSNKGYPGSTLGDQGNVASSHNSRKRDRRFDSAARDNVSTSNLTRPQKNSHSQFFTQHFDHVVLACHADQALDLVMPGQGTPERQVLRNFPYQSNVATLHTDISVLPRLRRAWAAWNYRIPARRSEMSTVTYNMNVLQSLETQQGLKDGPGEHVFCVTLNNHDSVDPRTLIAEFNYAHPVFSIGRAAAQTRQGELIDCDGLSYCGAYWANGFHEDGVNSALKVCERLLGIDPWKAVSTPGGSAIGDSIPARTRSPIESS